VASDETEKAVGSAFAARKPERFLADVRADEPELAERLRLEPVELEGRTA
jgi:hypothetical protein